MRTELERESPVRGIDTRNARTYDPRGTRTGTVDAFDSPRSVKRPRILHSVGHLLRGGIEMGLFGLLTSESADCCEHHVLVRTAEKEPFTDDFRNAGIPVLCCASYRNPIRYALDLRRLVRENGPYDILHVHGSSFSGLLTLAFARRCGIPWTIVHSHNDVRPTLRERGLLARAYVASVLAAYRRLAKSGFAASVLAAESMFGEQWQSDPRWEVFYYGIDCRPFQAPADPYLRRRLGIEDSALVIGHVGRFHEQKNHAFLLDVVEVAVRTDPNVVCLLIGDGPLRGEFVKTVSRRGLEQHFRFVPDTLEVAAYMTSAMDCFVFPSRYEGLGLVVVEAQAAGLPCIVSDRIPSEAIVDGSPVSVLPLEAGAATWADTALRMSLKETTDRRLAVGRIEKSRFNLENSAAMLWERYARFAQG